MKSDRSIPKPIIPMLLSFVRDPFIFPYSARLCQVFERELDLPLDLGLSLTS